MFNLFGATSHRNKPSQTKGQGTHGMHIYPGLNMPHSPKKEASLVITNDEEKDEENDDDNWKYFLNIKLR